MGGVLCCRRRRCRCSCCCRRRRRCCCCFSLSLSPSSFRLLLSVLPIRPSAHSPLPSSPPFCSAPFPAADYARVSEQYAWLLRDLAAVDRARTPWLLVVMHAPWYNSNYAHQVSVFVCAPESNSGLVGRVACVHLWAVVACPAGNQPAGAALVLRCGDGWRCMHPSCCADTCSHDCACRAPALPAG